MLPATTQSLELGSESRYSTTRKSSGRGLFSARYPTCFLGLLLPLRPNRLRIPLLPPSQPGSDLKECAGWCFSLPVRPKNPTISPLPMEKLIPFNAWIAPYFLVKFRTSTMGSGFASDDMDRSQTMALFWAKARQRLPK